MIKNKIFGIGLNKTGTTSLGKAIANLGFDKHTSCNINLLRDYQNGNISSILKLAEDYNNFEDWPWPLIYKDLYFEFPDSKFILTIRESPEVWFSSLCNHAKRTGPTEHRKIVYGYEMPQSKRSAHIRFYNFHNQSVTDFFNKQSPNNFLTVCWEKGDGYDKLCKFLDIDNCPSESFPHLNKSINQNNNFLMSTLSKIKRFVQK
ncbi:MAG: sulfotransferase [Bacteroidota bacterium]